MRYLLDTNVVSEVARSRGSARVKNWLLQNEPVCGLPSVVVAERCRGAYLSEHREKILLELTEAVSQFADRIIPFDVAAAMVWGEYTTRHEVRAADPGIRDTLIAATAISRGLIVVTRNTKHFPGVETLNPF